MFIDKAAVLMTQRYTGSPHDRLEVGSSHTAAGIAHRDIRRALEALHEAGAEHMTVWELLAETPPVNITA